MDYGRPGAFCGDVDPIRRRPCGTTRPGAEALRAETALPGPPNPEFLSPAPSCLDQPTRDAARHAGDARGSAASALAEPQMARDRLGPQRKRDDQAAGREGEECPSRRARQREKRRVDSRRSPAPVGSSGAAIDQGESSGVDPLRLIALSRILTSTAPR